MIWAGPTVSRLCPSYDLRADCHAPCPTYTILGKLIVLVYYPDKRHEYTLHFPLRLPPCLKMYNFASSSAHAIFICDCLVLVCLRLINSDRFTHSRRVHSSRALWGNNWSNLEYDGPKLLHAGPATPITIGWHRAFSQNNFKFKNE